MAFKGFVALPSGQFIKNNTGDIGPLSTPSPPTERMWNWTCMRWSYCIFTTASTVSYCCCHPMLWRAYEALRSIHQVKASGVHDRVRHETVWRSLYHVSTIVKTIGTKRPVITSQWLREVTAGIILSADAISPSSQCRKRLVPMNTSQLPRHWWHWKRFYLDIYSPWKGMTG